MLVQSSTTKNIFKNVKISKIRGVELYYAGEFIVSGIHLSGHRTLTIYSTIQKNERALSFQQLDISSTNTKMFSRREEL
jgi:hypothetical protein